MDHKRKLEDIGASMIEGYAKGGAVLDDALATADDGTSLLSFNVDLDIIDPSAVKKRIRRHAHDLDGLFTAAPTDTPAAASGEGQHLVFIPCGIKVWLDLARKGSIKAKLFEISFVGLNGDNGLKLGSTVNES